MPTPVQDNRDQLVQKILASMEKGIIPWRKPWSIPMHDNGSIPMNPVTDAQYRGANRVILDIAMCALGTDDNRFLTYKQAQSKGWSVKKGEKAIAYIEYFQPVTKEANSKEESDALAPEKAESSSYFLRKAYPVFHASQLDGIEPLERPMGNLKPEEQEYLDDSWMRLGTERAQTILTNSGAIIEHSDRNVACYNPVKDKITLPRMEFFTKYDDYYSTAIHELAHWTGHSSRLARFGEDNRQGGAFGTESYAKEELRAELASAFLVAQAGVRQDVDNHASYLKSWMKVLAEDKNEFFNAAKDAAKIADFIEGLMFVRLKDREADPQEKEVSPKAKSKVEFER